jgi:hypothetical protein
MLPNMDLCTLTAHRMSTTIHHKTKLAIDILHLHDHNANKDDVQVQTTCDWQELDQPPSFRAYQREIDIIHSREF